MDFKENITPPKGSEAEAKPLNMVFRGYPAKERDGYVLHAYLDQSARTGFDKDPSKYEQVETAPYLTPKQNGPFQADGYMFISGKMVDMLMDKAHVVMHPENGVIEGSMTTTMTQRNGKWQPDFSNISGKGFYQTARVNDPAKFAERVDKCISLPREAGKYLAGQAKEAKAAEAQAGLEDAAKSAPKAPAAEAPAPIAEPAQAEAPVIPDADLEL